MNLLGRGIIAQVGLLYATRKVELPFVQLGSTGVQP